MEAVSIDAVCMKVGIAYKAEFVNQLYKQFSKHHVGDFYCYTDNPRGINPEVKCVTFEPRHDERMWWNKTYLWQPGLFNNPTVFFDLDCVIHNPIDQLVYRSSHDKPNFLRTHWFSDEMAKIVHNCNVNSSIMVIHQNNYEELWHEYKSNMEKIFKSFYGIDGWVFRRHSDLVNFLPPKLAYSLKYGSMYPDDSEQDVMRDSNHVVCILDNVQDKETVLKKMWGYDVPSSS
tara:strand:- start:1137 stop:1829 length:693 start_codon:yes stop_codon:yes gene_type:complete